MKKEFYPHKVAAVYQDVAAAQAAVNELNNADLDHAEIKQLGPDTKNTGLAIEPEPEASRDTLTKDTIIGGAVGTAAGAAVAGTAALVSSTLFVSAPVVGPLVVLGYGSVIGGIAGAIRGLRLREGMFAGIVKDALKAGYHVIIVHAENEEALHRAQSVIDETMADKTTHI